MNIASYIIKRGSLTVKQKDSEEPNLTDISMNSLDFTQNTLEENTFDSEQVDLHDMRN